MRDGSTGALRRVDAIVHGDVQGVGFRMWVVGAAGRAGLVGWVANDSRGSVRCVAEGSMEALNHLLDALRLGPPAAAVDRVEASWSAATGEFSTFSVRSGWHAGD